MGRVSRQGQRCVGCDKRSGPNGWCAGAGDFLVTTASTKLEKNLRAGTPESTISPLVTPYVTHE